MNEAINKLELLGDFARKYISIDADFFVYFDLENAKGLYASIARLVLCYFYYGTVFSSNITEVSNYADKFYNDKALQHTAALVIECLEVIKKEEIK